MLELFPISIFAWEIRITRRINNLLPPVKTFSESTINDVWQTDLDILSNVDVFSDR